MYQMDWARHWNTDSWSSVLPTYLTGQLQSTLGQRDVMASAMLFVVVGEPFQSYRAMYTSRPRTFVTCRTSSFGFKLSHAGVYWRRHVDHLSKVQSSSDLFPSWSTSRWFAWDHHVLLSDKGFRVSYQPRHHVYPDFGPGLGIPTFRTDGPW